MATLEELVVSLVAETSGLRAELDKAAKATQAATNKMDDAIKSFSDNSSKNVGFFQSALGTMAGFLGSELVLGAVSKVKDALAFLGGELLAGADSAIKEEQALTKLGNALALSGNYSQDALKGLKDFADQVEATTGIEDDLVESNLAVLSSITKLDSEGLKKAQQSAIDLSSAFGIDLDTATRLVGKGVEGNVEAFKKYGITIQEGTTKTENLTNILTALHGVQGTAAASTANFAGEQLKMSQAIGNSFEALAKVVTQNPAFVMAMAEVRKIFTAVTTAIEDNSGILKQFAGEALVGAIRGLAMFVTALDAVDKVVKVLADTITAPFKLLTAEVGAAVEIIHLNFAGAFEGMKGAVKDVFSEIKKDATDTTVFGTVAEKLLAIGDAAESGMSRLSSQSDIATASIANQSQAFADLTQKQIENGIAGKTLSEELINNMINDSDLKSQILTDQEANEQALLAESFAQKLIQKEEYLAALEQLDLKYDTIRNANKNKANLEQLKIEKVKSDATIGLAQATANLLTAIGGEQNKAAFLISKAAAIAQAYISANLASANALANPLLVYPANVAVSRQLYAAGLLNVAAIAATAIKGFKTGITNVPGVGTADSFPAMLAPGERVVPSKTNEDLTAFLAQAQSGGAGGEVRIELSMKDQMVEFIEAKILERQRIGISLLQGAV